MWLDVKLVLLTCWDLSAQFDIADNCEQQLTEKELNLAPRTVVSDS